jgi:hypothetical protein
VSTADAVAREAAWLSTTGDGLPSLLKSAGGPWDVIQAYRPRTPATQKTQLWVLRRRVATERFLEQRRIPTYHFHVAAWWPIGATSTGTAIAEAEQAALDAAIDLLIQRIEGYPSDKSHGGRFMSVAEAPAGSAIGVEFGDPDQGIAVGAFSASIIYSADDQDYTA